MNLKIVSLSVASLLIVLAGWPGGGVAANPVEEVESAPRDFRVAAYDEATGMVNLSWTPPMDEAGAWVYTIYVKGEALVRDLTDTHEWVQMPQGAVMLFYVTATGQDGNESSPSNPLLLGTMTVGPVTFSVCLHPTNTGGTTNPVTVWFGLHPECVPKLEGDPLFIHCFITTTWHIELQPPFVSHNPPSWCDFPPGTHLNVLVHQP